MLVLMEGPDGAGKSHAATHELAAYMYQHNGPPPWTGSRRMDLHSQIMNSVFWWQLRNLMPKTSQPRTVVDRSWPSEQIYGKITARPIVFDALAHRMFERYMLSESGVIVLCMPPYHVAYNAWKARVAEGKELLTEDWQFAELWDFYDSLPYRTCVPLIRYDHTDPSQREHLTTRVNTAHRRTGDNPLPGVIYGNPRAPILIVGEQYNVGDNAEGPHIPFVGTGVNGRWLNSQLNQLGLDEDCLCWVNARQPDGSVTSAFSVQNALSHVQCVITLGRIADLWRSSTIWSSRIKFINVRHPAYQTRFKSDERWELHNHREYLQSLTDYLL